MERLDLVWPMVHDCTRTVHPYRDPIDAEYAFTRARMIFYTMGMESWWRWRRQNTVQNPAGKTGGHGYAQIEAATLRAAMRYLDRKPMLRDRLAGWLFPPENFAKPMPSDWYQQVGEKAIITSLWCSLAANIAWCNLVFYIKPGRIPVETEAMFNYWLAKYNGRGVLKHKTRAQAFDSWLEAVGQADLHITREGEPDAEI